MENIELYSLTVESKRAKKYNASLSTMWMKNNFTNLQEFSTTAIQMGFAGIELNHQMNSAMLGSVSWNGCQIRSIHEPCPADISLDTLKTRDWLISALDEGNRQRGVEAVKRSIDLAIKIDAKYIVVHAGSIISERGLEKELRRLLEIGQKGSMEYQALLIETTTERAQKAGPHFESVLKSLGELLEYARGSNVRLGIENRYHYLEIPSPIEMETLLNLAGMDAIGFVYDTGHAEVLDRLGFYPHEEWLKGFADRIIGAHLHDVIGVTDHYAAGLGEIDFDRVGKYLPLEANRVCEFQATNTRQQVKDGLRFLSDHGCIYAE